MYDDGRSIEEETSPPRPCGRNTFITTSYAPRPDWPMARDTARDSVPGLVAGATTPRRTLELAWTVP